MGVAHFGLWAQWKGKEFYSLKYMKGVGKSVLLVCKRAQKGLEMDFMAEEKVKKTFCFF